MAKKIWLITFGECSRLERFREESLKRGVDLEIIKTYNIHITDDKVIRDGEEISFQKGDVIWTISNNAVAHHLIRYLSARFGKKIKFIWTNTEAINYSDKFFGNSFFSSIAIPTPKTVFVNTFKDHKIERLVNYVGGYPCVIKANVGSMGSGVEMANSVNEIKEFIRKKMEARVDVPFRRGSFILQEFIKESAGTDFRVLVLDGKILGAIKRTAQNGDFKANVSLGGKAEIIKIDKEMKKMVKKIMKKGKIFYAGIDFIKSNRGYLALEINTSAQFKGFEKATGINVAGKIMEALLAKK